MTQLDFDASSVYTFPAKANEYLFSIVALLGWAMKVARVKKEYYRYWGKASATREDGGPEFHLLVYHSLDVAAVGMALLPPEKPLTRELAHFLDITPKQMQVLMGFCLALHDLGKFASAFQRLYVNDQSDLITPGRTKNYNGREYRHDRLGLYFWQEISNSKLSDAVGTAHLSDGIQSKVHDSLMVLMNCVLGHHGQPVQAESIGSMKEYIEDHNLQSAALFFDDMIALFNPAFDVEKLQSRAWRRRLEQVSWQLAGVAVLADWIGSDQSHFKYHNEEMDLTKYWSHAQKTAVRALAATDLGQPPKVLAFKSIQEYYGYTPTPLQHWAETVEVDDTPQLFILEDTTGSGKTEAALALTHRLMEAGAAEGFYFGLPTMATSNAMFSRIAQHYLQMFTATDGVTPSIVLAHGAREMNDEFREAILSATNPDSSYSATDSTATAQCNQWLADSRKKALLAPVGVGTVDQALLAVLPRRHQSLRLLGLNRKVLIFDEVHAADSYMFELMESLLALHLHQGGSAILLTATLPLSRRRKLVGLWQKAAGVPILPLVKTGFPMATKVTIKNEPAIEQGFNHNPARSKSVKVTFINGMQAASQIIIEAIAKGQCVVWIRNTVNDALAAYREVSEMMQQPSDCILFHSRFVLQDRKEIEAKVLHLFGKSSRHSQRAGKVLIATQVFQESLDADADIMISDLCPIDDLIQRTGRLHRHCRDAEGAQQRGGVEFRPGPILWINAPIWDDQPQSDWLSAEFINTQYVYRSPGRLWLAMGKLMHLGAIRMPGQARELIEEVYGDDASAKIPTTLQHQENELIGEERSKASGAKVKLIDWQRYGYSDQSANAWYDDDAGISTRHSDIATVEVLLVRRDSAGELVPWLSDRAFSVQLSSVKLSKHKYADKLARLTEQEEERFKSQFRQAKYLQCWPVDLDENFAYQPTTGFCEQQKEEAL